MNIERPNQHGDNRDRMTAARDRELREQLAELYRQAPTVMNITSAENKPVWPVHPASTAVTETGIVTGLWSYLVAELDTDNGVNLPLTQARTLLDDTAACFDVLAAITPMESEPARLAGIGPVARSAAEKASTAHWVLTGNDGAVAVNDRGGRLTRALIVEIHGIEQLLGFYPEIETAEMSAQLEAARTRLISIGETECGPVVYTKKSGRLLSLAGIELPSLTARVSAATMNTAYAEQSSGTHPTGHSAFVSSHTSSTQHGIVYYDRRSTVHGESRLIEPAVMSLGLAVANVGMLIGPCDHWPLPEWAISVSQTWRTWCEENGCN